MCRMPYVSPRQPRQDAVVRPIVQSPEPTAQGSHEISLRVQTRHVLILGVLTALAPLSTDLYLPSLPSVSHDLGVTMSLTQITLTACILGLALGQVIVGPISDARGRRRPLLLGIAIFTLASLLCLLAPSVGALIILRLVQGLAGATGIVLALAIARDLYDGLALARCVSLLMTVNFVAPIVAPVLGGQLLRWTSWRGVFASQALIGVVLLLAVAVGLRESLPADRRRRDGIAATLGTFRTLLAGRRFVGYTLASGFAFAAGIVYISVSPFILERVYGLSPQAFSLVFGINALGLTAVAQIGARLIGRVSPHTLLAWGVAALTLAGMTLLAVVLGRVGLLGIVPPLFVLTASLGFIGPNATALALATADTRTAGSASALLGAVQFSIGAIVAPLVGVGGTTTAIPMATVIGVFALASLVTLLALRRSSNTREVAGLYE